MSEDADIKVVLTETGSQLSNAKIRKCLGDMRTKVAVALTNLGLVEDKDQAQNRNNNRFLHSQWSYGRSYDSAVSLRPNLQLEFITRNPMLPTTTCSLQPLADRLAGRTGGRFNVETISIAETRAEKVISFLRRYAHHRSDHKRDWDTSLVRHIYDVHCINNLFPDLTTVSAHAFVALVNGDVDEFGRQQPEFAQDPFGVMTRSLDAAKTDAQTRAEYEQNLLPMVYGNFKPRWEEAFTGFEQVAHTFLDPHRPAPTDKRRGAVEAR